MEETPKYGKGILAQMKTEKLDPPKVELNSDTLTDILLTLSKGDNNKNVKPHIWMGKAGLEMYYKNYGKKDFIEFLNIVEITTTIEGMDYINSICLGRINNNTK